MSNKPLESEQSILGYVLKERIGAGGYGEVWSAKAPGGMMKAVKFIYGFHDENRAQRELKALDRVKEVRHPFLLSLERIDIVDGRMVVISELADMCLKTRFNSYREKGEDGIPREELLSYMKEAADALDYLAVTCSLAHLDIKPENLLLVGSHVKVADFGLVKDIQVTNQSLMDGLTPAYAAPELFDGQPGLHSDQYSLAIVYQELLTGGRPFSGTTAAQLASQHLHSRPNLNSLPRCDHAVIAKALTKDPDKRFGSCQELINELAKRRVRKPSKKNEGPKQALDPINTQEDTNVGLDIGVDTENRLDMTMEISESFIPAVKHEGEIEKLLPLDLDPEEAQLRPTLIIGVGKTASKVMMQYRRRMSQHFGGSQNTPAIRMLLIDVDRRSLFESTLGNENEVLENHELLATPLRKPEEYRSDADLDVSWIGRRWIYNIPKSQLTESMRPLGRLAFVDHHAPISERIRDELSKIATPEALVKTCENTRLNPSELTPQVIIVSSIAGAAGSGMILDLAFTVRVCMGELGLTDEHVYGLFAHGTSRHGGDSRLAIVNTYAFLNELFHFNLNGYPGADSCGIPEFEDGTPAFDTTHLVHMGDDLSQSEYLASTDGMAEYLFLGTVTRSSVFFEQSREEDEFDPGSINTMGINFVCRGKEPIVNGPARRLAKKMIDGWLKPKRNPETNEIELDPKQYAIEVLDQVEHLNQKRVESQIREPITKEFGDNPVDEILKRINEECKSQEVHNSLEFASDLLTRELGIRKTNEMELTSQKRKNSKICDAMEAKVNLITNKAREQISPLVLNLVNNPELRLGGSRLVAKSILETLNQKVIVVEQQLLKLDDLIAATRHQFDESLVSKSDNVAELCMAHVANFIELRIDRFELIFIRKLYQSVERALQRITDEIDEFTSAMRLVDQQWSLPLTVAEIDSSNDQDKRDLRENMIAEIGDHVLALLPQLERKIDATLIQTDGGLLDILRDGGHRMRRLPVEISQLAQAMVCQYAQQLRIDSLMRKSNYTAEEVAIWLKDLVHTAMPVTAGCGGTSRMLIAVPQRAPVTALASFIQNQFDHEANVVQSTSGDFVVCFEMGNMPMENVAMSILQMQPDCAELIERLHCRTDINWASLTPLC